MMMNTGIYSVFALLYLAAAVVLWLAYIEFNEDRRKREKLRHIRHWRHGRIEE